MNKHQILAVVTVIGGATLVELRTGWAFGSETPGDLPVLAASAAPSAGGGAGGGAIAGVDVRVRPGRPRAAHLPAAHRVRPAGPVIAAADAPVIALLREADQAPTGDGDRGWTVIGPAAHGWAPIGGEQTAMIGGGDRAGVVIGGGQTFGLGGPGVGDAAPGGNGSDLPAAFGATNAIETFSGVPEPASWLSLIAGMILVGVNFRRRQGPRPVAG